ncbi:hypothetical protein H0H81_007538 [Sphagnurus paluster]|uniref:NTF2 domain-containing protein n=1 Tax=Sphagnurus paluster TaxID=117069 RepID=A0A9P7K4I4_9AGAR|nr:hypothetical protein H0H81_007538 [Sphagnurus paluster]
MTAVPAIVKLTPNDVEIATRAADHFTRIYYSAYDSNTRLNDLPAFYRPTSSLVWNGKPFQGAAGMRELIEKMPVTKHEVQSFDCHPIPGTSPPSLLVSVSGSVTHGLGPSGNPTNITPRNPEGHPRVFSQTFMLVPDPTAPATKPGEVAKYYVSSDALRFVG